MLVPPFAHMGVVGDDAEFESTAEKIGQFKRNFAAIRALHHHERHPRLRFELARAILPRQGQGGGRMGWWDRAEEELPADNGLGPLCWGSMAVSMLVSAIMGVATWVCSACWWAGRRR